MQASITARAPTAETSRPENGMAASDPTAMNSKAKPRPRSLAPRSSLIAGRREIQVANSPPLTAKTTRVAHTARRTSPVPAACCTGARTTAAA